MSMTLFFYLFVFCLYLLYFEINSIFTSDNCELCFDASKPRVAASTGPQYQYVHGIFSDVIKISRCCCSTYAMGERNPVPATGL